MRHVIRSESSKPASFDKAVAPYRAQVEEFFKRDKSERLQKKHRANVRVLQKFKRPLAKLFHRKCAFCETRLETDLSNCNIVWFRPKADAMDLKGNTDPDHYWWLIYEWSNLYPACTPCSRQKSSRFPVDGPRAEPGFFDEDLENEKRLIYDPCQNTRFKFSYLGDGKIEPANRMAATTVEVFGLNRTQLVRDRKKVIDELNPIISDFERLGRIPKGVRTPAENKKFDRLLQKLKQEDQQTKTFSSLRRQLAIEARARVFRGTVVQTVEKISGTVGKWFSKFVGVDESVTSGADWITRIEIKNFKSIQDIDITFPEGGTQTDLEPWLMLLGENGVGKSSILKAIALSFMDETQLRQYLPDPVSAVYDRAKPRQTTIRVHFNSTEEPLQLRFGRNIDGYEITGNRPQMSLLAYGATRLPPPVDEVNTSEQRRVRLENLFDPRASLSDAEPWLADTRRVKAGTFNKLATALRTLLSLDENAHITRKAGRLFVAQEGTWVPIREMSDGYQSIIALATDIMLNLATDWESMSSAEGTVLLDEIEVHLHPKWKIEIVSCLREVFPRVHFVVTTHDPLCLHGLQDGEIYRLYKNPRKLSYFRRSLAHSPGSANRPVVNRRLVRPGYDVGRRNTRPVRKLHGAVTYRKKEQDPGQGTRRDQARTQQTHGWVWRNVA